MQVDLLRKNATQKKQKLTTAWSSESANALDVDTSKLRPTAAAVRIKGSSISLVGLGWRLNRINGQRRWKRVLRPKLKRGQTIIHCNWSPTTCYLLEYVKLKNIKTLLTASTLAPDTGRKICFSAINYYLVVHSSFSFIGDNIL